MSGLIISKHAAMLVGELWHAGSIRRPHEQLLTSLENAASAARHFGLHQYLIKVDGAAFLVRGGTVVTAIQSHAGYARAALLADRSGHA